MDNTNGITWLVQPVNKVSALHCN